MRNRSCSSTNPESLCYNLHGKISPRSHVLVGQRLDKLTNLEMLHHEACFVRDFFIYQLGFLGLEH